MNNKKRIFNFVSTNCLSGLENVVINISLLLRSKYDFIYVSPSGPINYYLNKYGIPHIIVNKLTVTSVRKVIKQYKPNIVQGHDVKASLYLASNYFLCKKYDIKIISELHNDDPRMWCYSFRSVLYLFSSIFYDNIIVISKPVIKNYIFKRFILNKTTIINNIVNPFRIKLNNLNFNINKRWDCMFLGRFVDQKNPIKFIKVIYNLKKRNNNISAVMVGNGYLMNDVKNIINIFNLNNNIRLCGFQRNPYKYILKSKIMLVTSRYEGFGLVALESLLCGVPVISSYTGGLKYIINNSCGGFAKNVKTYVNKINKLLTNNKLYNTVVKNCIKHVHKINDVNTFIHKYNNIYKSKRTMK